VTLGSLRKATAAIGADVDVFLRWRGERLDRLLDDDPSDRISGLLFLSIDSHGGRIRGTGGRERVRPPRRSDSGSNDSHAGA
jgi:hypothetical protein